MTIKIKMMNNVDKKNGNVCGIYCISNSKYFYIGLSRNIRNRWGQHKRALKAGTHYNVFMQRVYNKYNLSDPFEYNILCECEPENLGTLEKKYFDEFQKNSHKIALNEKECGLHFWSDDSIEKSKKSHTGHKHSEKTKKKISEGQKGSIRNSQRIPIVQLSLDGEFIKLWDSKVTVKKELGINVSMNRKQCGGFQWQKYVDYIKSPKGKLKYDNVKEVCQYSKTGEFIKKYNSIQEASDFTGIKHCNISNALNGVQKTAGGYIWK